MEHSDTVGKLAAALVAVQSKLKPLRRNADNPFFKSSYTDLAALSETILPLLSAEGIALVQGGDGSTLDTILLHTSGEWIRASLPMPAESNPQKLGSSITYFRRYALAAIVGAVSEGEDDDGNAASHTPARQPSAHPPANRPAPESAARPATPAAPPAPGGSPALLSVVYLDNATGEKNGKAWTRYTAKFSDGTKASTFSATHGEALAQAKSTGEAVYCKFEKNGNFTNLIDVQFATDAPDDGDNPF